MGSDHSIIPGMVDYSKTDLRFPTSGQQAHDAQIIHLVLFIHSLEMFIFSLGGLTPEYFGSADLRKTLFQVMDVLIKMMPQDDPVYQFLDKKRSQGKPYYVYMTAGANKFLRIYYGRVKEYLASLPES